MNKFNVGNLNIDTQDIAERLFSLKEHWQLRSEYYPFYTLGKSAYLDGASPEYHNHHKTDIILIDNFEDLILSIITYLSEFYGEKILLTDDLAVPGFHIFESNLKFEGMSGSWHYDLPHQTLKIDGADNSTVTVVIKIPKSGAGLDWIDDNGHQQYLAYNEQDIITHNGMTPHRIAAFKDIVDGEYRITMQGHLIRKYCPSYLREILCHHEALLYS